MIRYPIEVTPDDNGTLIVTCPDLPLVLSFGDDVEDAMRHAVDAIETALAAMIDDHEDIPMPTSRDGAAVRLPVQTELKVRLYLALRDARMSRADLQHRLGWKRESIDRLFRLDHNSRLSQLDAAFQAIGQDIDVSVRPAAA